MRRLLVCALMLLAMGTWAAARAETTTILVYMCGADLEASACDDLYEMGQAENGKDVNIVILAGGSDKWEYEEIAGGTRNLIAIRDGCFESVEDWGRKSMGSGESLLEFLEYGMKEYPADRTAVILWNHGAGSEAGMCFDSPGAEEDGLSLIEINDALYDLNEALGGFHIDILGCDACMMATYEMAAMLSFHNVDYFIASEELEPGCGWNYTPWLKALEKDATLSTEKLCGMIVDSYMEAALTENPDDYLTLSAIDLRETAALVERFEDFAASILAEIKGGKLADIRRLRSRMYTLGSFADASWDMVDMAEMLDVYAQIDPDSAARARRQLARAVLVSRQTDNLNPCCGLSVLMPQDTKDEYEYYSAGMDLSFYMPNWIGFVKEYAKQLYGGSYSFTPGAVEQGTGSDFFSQIAGLMSETIEGLGWSEEAETYVPEAQQNTTVTCSESDYAFTATLSAEDLQYLDSVEGMLALDISDGEVTAYVDFGLMQNNLINWKTGEVYSMFDGTWPVFCEQMVPLYDQLRNERGRRCLMPVKLNGEYTYLVVEFAADGREGRILGANAGYDDNGLPIRETTRLKEGDRIVPIYTMFVDTGGEEMEEKEFEGDEILWKDGMTVTYEDLTDAEEPPLNAMFCFVLNDVFGDYTMTDLISFEF